MLTQTEADELWKYLKDLPVAMMATREGGRIRARPMHKVQKEFSGKLWFFTALEGAKTDEIDEHHEVCLSYEDTGKQVYVSVSGTARTLHDQALIDKFWNPLVSAWFPEGKEDPHVGLIEVQVHQAELWDANSNRMTQLVKMTSANMRDTKPDLGEHRQFGRH